MQRTANPLFAGSIPALASIFKVVYFNTMHYIIIFFFYLSISYTLQAANKAHFDSLLVEAADKNSLSSVKQLIQDGSSVEERSEFGVTALMRASYQGSKDIVAYLLQQGADPEAVDLAGTTALHFAARCGAVDIVDLLIKYGAIIDEKDDQGYTPLMKAIMAGKSESVKILIYYGASLSTKNKDGNDSLKIAKSLGRKEIISYLENYISPLAGEKTVSIKQEKININTATIQPPTAYDDLETSIIIRTQNNDIKDSFVKEVETTKIIAPKNQNKENIDQQNVTSDSSIKGKKEDDKLPVIVIEDDIDIAYIPPSQFTLKNLNNIPQKNTKLDDSEMSLMPNTSSNNVKVVIEDEIIISPYDRRKDADLSSNTRIKNDQYALMVGNFTNLDEAKKMVENFNNDINTRYLHMGIVPHDKQYKIEIKNFKNAMTGQKLCDSLNNTKRWSCDIRYQ